MLRPLGGDAMMDCTSNRDGWVVDIANVEDSVPEDVPIVV
jgi:hypothetical protein